VNGDVCRIETQGGQACQSHVQHSLCSHESKEHRATSAFGLNSNSLLEYASMVRHHQSRS